MSKRASKFPREEVPNGNSRKSFTEPLSTKKIPPHPDLCGGNSAVESLRKKGEEVPEKPVRPSGARKAVEAAKMTDAMRKGADGILSLAAESRRQNDIKQSFLDIKRRESRMQLFQMEGTSKEVLRIYREREQKRALQELEQELLLDEMANVPQDKSNQDDKIQGSASSKLCNPFTNRTELKRKRVEEAASVSKPLKYDRVSTDAELLLTLGK